VVPTTTTVVPTTVVPTTPPYTGPTGQVFFFTAPQGAHIVLDGVLSNEVTPIVMTVPTGSHVAILKLAGYDEIQADFSVSTNAMTTVSKRFSPGTSVIPTTPGTPVPTVVTTVPTTTVTQVTTSPTIAPTTIPTASNGGIFNFPSWATQFIQQFPWKWGL
jgi:hypothetical protein